MRSFGGFSVSCVRFSWQVFSPAKEGMFVFFAIMNGLMVTALLLFWLGRLLHFGRGPNG